MQSREQTGHIRPLRLETVQQLCFEPKGVYTGRTQQANMYDGWQNSLVRDAKGSHPSTYRGREFMHVSAVCWC